MRHLKEMTLLKSRADMYFSSDLRSSVLSSTCHKVPSHQWRVTISSRVSAPCTHPRDFSRLSGRRFADAKVAPGGLVYFYRCRSFTNPWIIFDEQSIWFEIRYFARHLCLSSNRGNWLWNQPCRHIDDNPGGSGKTGQWFVFPKLFGEG